MGNRITQPQQTGTIEENMAEVNFVEGLELKTMYATIAIAQMMYSDYLDKEKLKDEIATFEGGNK